MQARRGEAQHDVTRHDPRPVNHVRALDEPDAGAREVELLVPVDPRQLGALTAEERAARSAADLRRALDELGDLLHVQPVGGDVVEEKKRLRARAEQVVDAMRREVGSAPAQLSGPSPEHELRANAVRRGSQQPLLVESEQTREAAELAHHAGRAGRTDRRP